MVSEKSGVGSAKDPKSEGWTTNPETTYHNSGLNIKPLMVSLPLTVLPYGKRTLPLLYWGRFDVGNIEN